MSAAPTCVLFAAPLTAQFQSPPYVRSNGIAVLLLRVPTTDEGGRATWRLPFPQEFEHPGNSTQWTETTDLVRLDALFDPPGVLAGDAQWLEVAFAASCLPSVYEPGVLPALRRFIRDQRLDDILARADAATHLKGASMEPRSVFIEMQLRAQRAYGDAGAPPPLQGESSHDYECRLVKPHLPHSKQFSGADINKVRDPMARAMIAESAYADSAAYVAPGTMREIKIRDASGREITKYEGDDSACWNQFAPPRRYVRRILTPGTTMAA